MILTYWQRLRASGRSRRQERGQSLVEMALFAPIFIIMIAGLVEVGQLVVTQNRINTASRSAARFGANGGQDEGMQIVALNAISQTTRISTDEGRWDMWVIKANVNEFGTDFVDWQTTHIYGIGQTTLFTDTQATLTTTLKTEVWDNLFEPGESPADVTGLSIVGSLVLYESDSILGINNLWDDPYTVRGLNVLRLSGLDLEQTNGCATFPIAIPHDARSIQDVEFPQSYTYPTGRIPSITDFPLHQPSRSLEDSREGFVYVFPESQIQWLAWNPAAAGPGAVAASLAWPGNSLHDPPRGYLEPGSDPADTSLHVEDFVQRASGSFGDAGIASELQRFIDKGRTMRIIVWDELGGTTIRIGSFAIFRMHGYGPQGLTAEFLRIDTSCGQLITGT